MAQHHTTDERGDFSSHTTSKASQLSRSFMLSVYNWMALGLAFTGVIALLIVSSKSLLITIASNRLLFYGLLIGELIMVMIFVSMVSKVKTQTAILMFFAYAGLNGITLSVLFLIYTAGSIASTFFITAGTFAAVSVFGYVTKRDLSGVGHFMIMGLFGLIIASIVNIFLASPALYWISTYAGVLIFTGLTAYDTQRIKEMAQNGQISTKAAILGALVLYLDFINLFLFLLRIFGGRR